MIKFYKHRQILCDWRLNLTEIHTLCTNAMYHNQTESFRSGALFRNNPARTITPLSDFFKHLKQTQNTKI